MLHLFKNVAEGREQHPQYVIDLQYQSTSSSLTATARGKKQQVFIMGMSYPLFILNRYLPKLRETFRPFLHHPDEIIPGINVPQIFLGQLMGIFSCWHVEDLNPFSINKLHFSKPKNWIV
jgi:hypothetical protein